MTEAVALKHPAYRVWRDIPEQTRLDRIQTALQRVVNDERTEDIAKDLGISRSALNMAFLEYAEDDWKKAQVARAMTRLERAKDYRDSLQQKIETATKDDAPALALMLTRARDDEKSAQWELERTCRRIYGQDQPVEKGAGISITLNLRGKGATIAAQHDEIVVEPDGAQR